MYLHAQSFDDCIWDQGPLSGTCDGPDTGSCPDCTTGVDDSVTCPFSERREFTGNEHRGTIPGSHRIKQELILCAHRRMCGNSSEVFENRTCQLVQIGGFKSCKLAGLGPTCVGCDWGEADPLEVNTHLQEPCDP